MPKAKRWMSPLRERDLSYVEWIAAARDYPNQNEIWRRHELFARENQASVDPLYQDLGGEA